MDTPLYIPASYIKQKATEIGFDNCGIAQAEHLNDFSEQYLRWLTLGYNADMHYMEQNIEKRSNPTLLVGEAQSVISVIVGYKPSQNLSQAPFVAQYAYSEDYHKKIKTMLFRLINAIQTDYPTFKATAYVDTAPISDKIWAQRSGLGWIGKHTLLINAQLGSWLNIGELVCNIKTEYDKPIANSCGECTKCIDICPNGAITNSGINANKCIAYHTIENKAEQLPSHINLAGYVFGCDICQKACPHNAKAEAKIEITNEKLKELENIGNIDETAFKKIRKNTAMDRIKYAQLLRNIEKNNNNKK